MTTTVGCVLVIVGLVFEDWIASLLGMGQVAVVVGVMIEGLGDGAIFLASGKLQMIQESELEHMRLETAQATQKQTEAALRLEQLKKQVAWRHIPADEFLKALQSGPKARMVNILYLRDDPECWCLAKEFLDVLNRAHWPFGFPEPIKPNETLPFSMYPSTESIGANPTGISVEVNKLKFPDREDTTAFGVLTNAIVDTLGGVSPRENKSLPDGVFRIILGPKEGRFFR